MPRDDDAPTDPRADREVSDSAHAAAGPVARFAEGGGIDVGLESDRQIDPEGLSFAELRNAIGALEAAGRPTQEAETILWHKI